MNGLVKVVQTVKCVFFSLGMQSREERSNQYFETDITGGASYAADDAEELFDKVRPTN